MKTLERNKRIFYYALFVESRPHVDDYGNETTEVDLIYGNPVFVKANISSAKGEVAIRLFGSSEDYDRLIVVDDPQTPINEYSILWVDTLPVLVDGETVTPHDYVVTKVARSLNSASIAIRKVTVA